MAQVCDKLARLIYDDSRLLHNPDKNCGLRQFTLFLRWLTPLVGASEINKEPEFQQLHYHFHLFRMVHKQEQRFSLEWMTFFFYMTGDKKPTDRYNFQRVLIYNDR